jgi:hypothetical protein
LQEVVVGVWSHLRDHLRNGVDGWVDDYSTANGVKIRVLVPGVEPQQRMERKKLSKFVIRLSLGGKIRPSIHSEGRTSQGESTMHSSNGQKPSVSGKACAKPVSCTV